MPHNGSMNITYSQKLKDYMARKGYEHIVIEMVDSKTCCAGFADIVGRFADEKGVAKLSGKILRRFDGEVGDVIVTAHGLEYDEDVELGLRSFLGAKDITFKGIRPYAF